MDDARALERISGDPRARRELLWLRANEKGDQEMARGLERVDPRLVGRLRAAGLDIGNRAGESRAARRERFGRLWDECYDRHVRRLRESA
jgi:hypothetical protein